MRKIIAVIIVLAAVGAAIFWYLSAPDKLPQSAFDGLGAGDSEHGHIVFLTGGCTSCHAAPGAKGDDKLVLSGGLEIVSDFGTFHVPNISTDPKEGIGSWSLADFANALKQGVSPAGSHFYPSFPYPSYTRMTLADINDLWAYMKILPASSEPSRPHELPFPFNIRRGLGLWKLLFLHPDKVVAFDNADEQVMRGQYLAEGAGHCGECHTPRNPIGGSELAKWLSGAPNPDGPGIIPNITPGGELSSWSANDIAYYLESGFMPDFDTVGGSMVAVQRNLAQIPAEDRAAIAAYLKAIPGHPNGY